MLTKQRRIPCTAGRRLLERVGEFRDSAPVVPKVPEVTCATREKTCLFDFQDRDPRFRAEVQIDSDARMAVIQSAGGWAMFSHRDQQVLAMIFRRQIWAFCLVFVACPARAAEPISPPAATPEGVEFFEKRIRPLLVQHCYACHSAKAENLQGGLWLDSRAGVLKGGETSAALVPGKPDESLLIKAVRYEDLEMPPKAKLKDTEIADLVAWVKMGAPDPRTQATPPTASANARTTAFWSFQPVQDSPLPAVNDTALSKGPIDRFILAKLDEHGLRPAPAADKRTLLRRVTYDLTGLPPTPEEVDAFLADESPDAWSKLVDRLLASKAYGERWGRHWLDVVRYADTAGDNSDYPIPQMYKYRNWVIDAFNADMPYDAFIHQQLAGDLLPSESEEDRYRKLIATGYLANSKRFGSYEDARYPWHLTIEDTIDNLGRTFLGLTINCARCHDHKFDPVSNEDYYALYGFFQSTRYPWPGIELDKAQRDLVPLAPAGEIAAGQKVRQAKLAEHDAKIEALELEHKTNNATLSDAEKSEDSEEEKKTRIEKVTQRLVDLKQEIKSARKAREDFVRQPLPFELAYAVAEGKTEGKKKVGNACVQIKGDPERQGPEVPRRFPTVLGGQPLPADVSGSGRLELARWITDAANPLTARVMVNRIWQYHFGRGLAPTPSDFGKQGTPPTHPELLDWLALRFMDSGWSIKHMHRLILVSSAYQMSVEENESHARIDVDNRYLWRFERQRLDAESIRDTILAVSGGLDRTPGAGHPFPAQKSWDFTQHKPFKAVYEGDCRSVYLMTQRIQRHPYLALFDGPDTNASTARRITSTTPLQALYFMNDPLVHEQAAKFASRLLSERSDDAGRIEFAYLLLFARPPAADEHARALDYLTQIGEKLPSTPADERAAKCWESLVRALWMSNEFVYVN